MQNPKIYCMCLDEHHLENLKKLNYIPVGLGKNEYSKEWIRDNTGESISEKNPYYGEYTFIIGCGKTYYLKYHQILG